MTEDTTALIAELRKLRDYLSAHVVAALDRAADALEAQAQRITELEAALDMRNASIEQLVAARDAEYLRADSMQRQAEHFATRGNTAEAERDALEAQIAEALDAVESQDLPSWFQDWMRRILSAPASDAEFYPDPLRAGADQ